MKFTGKDGELRIYSRLYGYIKVHFSNMDFSSSIGRAKLEEKLILDNGVVNKYAHYINGTDQVIFDPFGISFSCVIEDVTGLNDTNGLKDVVYQALICRDARNDQSDGTWTAYGTSTKGNYQNVAGIDNPDFRSVIGTPIFTGDVTNVLWNGTNTVITDAASQVWVNGETTDCMLRFTSGTLQGKAYKIVENGAHTVNTLENIAGSIQIGDDFELYDNIRTVDVGFKMESPFANDITYTFREVYWPPNEIALAEAEDGITLSATGGVYGPVLRTSDWVVPV